MTVKERLDLFKEHKITKARLGVLFSFGNLYDNGSGYSKSTTTPAAPTVPTSTNNNEVELTKRDLLQTSINTTESTPNEEQESIMSYKIGPVAATNPTVAASTTTTPITSTSVTTGDSRADRNNNPLNIRYNVANPWQGRRANRTDNDFEEFETLEYGYRAGFKTMATHIKNGNDTYAKLIEKWAPKNENNTDGYVSRVIKALGVDKDTKIDPNDINVMTNLAREMAKVESGHDVDMTPIIAGYKMARTGL